MRQKRASEVSGAGPLYERVRGELLRRIGNGTYRGQIPTGAEMARDLGVGHGTLQKVTQRLKDEGILVARRGVGTFINWKVLESQERMNT